MPHVCSKYFGIICESSSIPSYKTRFILVISSPWLADKTFAKQTRMYAATFELRPFKLCKVAMNNKS